MISLIPSFSEKEKFLLQKSKIILTYLNQFSILFLFSNPARYALFVIDIICLLISNCIHVAVVMNYVCHCEMILFYCKTIRLRLEEKSIPLLESMKRILDLGASISQLNSAASRMMSILIICFLERTILGMKQTLCLFQMRYLSILREKKLFFFY